jgi:pimeloyl-ACP methyl ester carboxylesterase
MTPKVPVEHRTVTVKDVKLHYAIAGPGAPLVLLHGWPRRARAHDPRV